MAKEAGDKVGNKPRSMGPMKPCNVHLGRRSCADDPIEFLTGIFEKHPTSLAAELLDDRNKDDEIDDNRDAGAKNRWQGLH